MVSCNKTLILTLFLQFLCNALTFPAPIIGQIKNSTATEVTFPGPIGEIKNSTVTKFQSIMKSIYGVDLSNLTQLITLFGLDDEFYHSRKLAQNTRFKRQTHGGKFAEASRMGQTKLLRLTLQMVRNGVADVYLGAPHALHPLVPYIFCEILDKTVISYFSPDITIPGKRSLSNSLLFDQVFSLIVKQGELEKHMKGTMIEDLKSRRKRQAPNDQTPDDQTPDDQTLSVQQRYRMVTHLPLLKMVHMIYKVLKDFTGATSLGIRHAGGKPLSYEIPEPTWWLAKNFKWIFSPESTTTEAAYPKIQGETNSDNM